MSINKYSVIESVSTIIMMVDVDEYFVNGDVVANHTCRFFSKNGEDIGYAKIREDDQHKQVKADFNGRKLLTKFQYLA